MVIIFSQVRAICVQIAYHSKLEVSSLSGDFQNAHPSPAWKTERLPVTPRVLHTHTHRIKHVRSECHLPQRLGAKNPG